MQWGNLRIQREGEGEGDVGHHRNTTVLLTFVCCVLHVEQQHKSTHILCICTCVCCVCTLYHIYYWLPYCTAIFGTHITHTHTHTCNTAQYMGHGWRGTVPHADQELLQKCSRGSVCVQHGRCSHSALSLPVDQGHRKFRSQCPSNADREQVGP